MGGPEQRHRLQVVVDPETLVAHQITISEAIGVINRENVNIGAGSFDEGKRRYIVRTVGQYRHPEEVDEVVIRTENENRVRGWETSPGPSWAASGPPRPCR